MESPFTLDHVLPRLGDSVRSYLAQQRGDGAFVRADWGLDDPGATASLVALCLYVDALRGLYPGLMAGAPDSKTLHGAAERAMDYLLAYQRPSGLTDLRDCNFDSSPDAGFILQAICPALALAPPSAARDALERFARRMVAGTLDGGFHTPNHRWVIASGLAQAAKALPGVDVRATVDTYLAEGFDLDPDGFYIERSAGVYDAICDRSLLLLADAYDYPAAKEAALANLRANLPLFNADDTVETGLSRRQDYGIRSVPTGLIAPYLLGYFASGDRALLERAERLWRSSPGGDPYGVAQILLAHGEPGASEGDLPETFTAHYPHNALWRTRRGARTASVFGGVTRLMTLRFGQAELSSIKISQAYFGIGNFIGDALTVDAGGATLRSEGRSRPLRPGYEQPLGRPVPYDRYAEMRGEREVRRVADCTSALQIKEIEDGFRLTYRTLDGLDRVPAQIALDFPPGGVWESDALRFAPHAGQVLFLRDGFGAMRYGRDVIEIGPGADAHAMAAMRDAETAPESVRVLLTFLTPVAHAVTLRCYRKEL